MINYGDPWLIIELHDYVFSLLARHTTASLTITMNKMRKNETQLMYEQKWTYNIHEWVDE